ncbi:hypothetical protein AVEN_84646-1 [Araneus ventricosus]|uniref:Uncharacterized protein n=1 Tax=Araneus ventricosus TaxID=182803 RepID=A0A4Y2HKH7_ARAVE|nr:hypothetical protein AVEN_84646-1 [Araneus ventricosus]
MLFGQPVPTTPLTPNLTGTKHLNDSIIPRVKRPFKSELISHCFASQARCQITGIAIRPGLSPYFTAQSRITIRPVFCPVLTIVATPRFYSTSLYI